MIKLCKSVLILILIVIVLVDSNRVIELDEVGVEKGILKREEKWLIQFYAPWCHHCKQLEMIYSLLAQSVHNMDIGVYVGRVDGIKYSSLASYYGVRGFPTILFISKEKSVEFNGDREQEALIDFVKRMASPTIGVFSSCQDINRKMEESEAGVFFLSIGNHSLQQNYSRIADELHSSSWFYKLDSYTNCPGFNQDSVYVIKYNQLTKRIIPFDETSNSSLFDWINVERFPIFIRVTPANFQSLLQTKKYLVLVLVEEYKELNRFGSNKDKELYDLLEAIGSTIDASYFNQFIFGYTSYIYLINLIAIKEISPIPNFIIINTTSLLFYQFDSKDDILPQNILQMIQQLKHNPNDLQGKGGNTFYYKIIRSAFEAKMTFLNMYKGNAILTLVLFGLPLSFLSIIIYTTCTQHDLQDYDDDDEQLLDDQQSASNGHIKRD